MAQLLEEEKNSDEIRSVLNHSDQDLEMKEAFEVLFNPKILKQNLNLTLDVVGVAHCLSNEIFAVAASTASPLVIAIHFYEQ